MTNDYQQKFISILLPGHVIRFYNGTDERLKGFDRGGRTIKGEVLRVESSNVIVKTTRFPEGVTVPSFLVCTDFLSSTRREQARSQTQKYS